MPPMKEPTLTEIMQAIQSLGVRVEEKLDTAKQEFDDFTVTVGEFVERTEEQFKEIRGELKGVQNVLKDHGQRLNSIESNMVTKDHLDRKLADLRADLVMLARKGNKKLEIFVGELVDEGRMSKEAASRILSLEPFPQ